MQWLEQKKYQRNPHHLDQAYQDRLFKKCTVVVVEGEKVITAMLRFRYRATSMAMNTYCSHKDASMFWCIAFSLSFCYFNDVSVSTQL